MFLARDVLGHLGSLSIYNTMQNSYNLKDIPQILIADFTGDEFALEHIEYKSLHLEQAE